MPPQQIEEQKQHKIYPDHRPESSQKSGRNLLPFPAKTKKAKHIHQNITDTSLHTCIQYNNLAATPLYSAKGSWDKRRMFTKSGITKESDSIRQVPV